MHVSSYISVVTQHGLQYAWVELGIYVLGEELAQLHCVQHSDV
jgi:hypothetical protein